MSLIKKQFVICDKCGASQEINFTMEDPFGIAAMPDPKRDGWLAVDRGHHLCPSCAAVYKKRQAECDRELKELAGIKTISFDV